MHVNDRAREFVMGLLLSSDVQQAVTTGLNIILSEPSTQEKVKLLVINVLQVGKTLFVSALLLLTCCGQRGSPYFSSVAVAG